MTYLVNRHRNILRHNYRQRLTIRMTRPMIVGAIFRTTKPVVIIIPK